MRFEMFGVTDYQAWGILVKQWVRNEKPRPNTIKEFIDQVNAAGVGATIPVHYKDVEIIPTSSSDPILRIRIPPLDVLKNAEDALKDPYDLPLFYKDLMYNPNLKDDTPPPVPPAEPPPEGGRMIFHNHRVGEYTVKFCG